MAVRQNYGQPGTLWDGGPASGANGLSSERATFTAGTGGPEGDHVATVAQAFEVPGLVATGQNVRVTEVRPCLYHTGTTAEL
jgi:hypothetical protein